MEAIYDPLHYCPTRQRERYEVAARQATSGSFTKAIKLKCLDCSGWDRPETNRCQTFTCALWPFNRRMFRMKKPIEESAA